jgi:hypothetical protein
MSSSLGPLGPTPPKKPLEKGFYQKIKDALGTISAIVFKIFSFFSFNRTTETPSLKEHQITLFEDKSGSSTPQSDASSVSPSPRETMPVAKVTEALATKKLLPTLAVARGRAYLHELSIAKSQDIHSPTFLIELTRGNIQESDFQDCLLFYTKEGQEKKPNVFYQTLRQLLTFDTPYRQNVNSTFLIFFSRMDEDEQKAFIDELLNQKVSFDQLPQKQKELKAFEKCLNSQEPFLTKDEQALSEPEKTHLISEKKYTAEKALARRLRKETAPLLNALLTGDLSGQKGPQFLRYLKALENYPHLQQAILKKLSYEDLRHIIHNYASSTSYEDNFDPLTFEFIDTLKQARVDPLTPLPEDATISDELISKEDLLAIFNKTPSMSAGFSQLFFSLNKDKQDELIELIQKQGSDSLYKFEGMALRLFTGSSDQKKRFEKTLLAKFHPEIKEPIKTADKLILLFTQGFNYQEVTKEVLDHMTRDEFESLQLPQGTSCHSLLNPLFLDAIYKKCGETGLNLFITKVFNVHAGDLTADEKMSLERLFEHKYTLLKCLASKKENPKLALYALENLAYAQSKTPLSKEEELKLAKEALSFAKTNHIAIPVILIPTRLQQERELLQDTPSITILNECFKRIKNPQSIYPQYASMLGTSALLQDAQSFLSTCLHELPDFDKLEITLKEQKQSLEASIPAEKSPSSLLFAGYEEFDPSVVKIVDPLRQKAVVPSEYKKYADYKLGQINSMLDLIAAAKNLKRNPEKKDFEIKALIEDPGMEDSMAFPFDSGYISLGCFLYGAEFFTKIFMDTPEHRLDSFYKDFASSGVRQIEEQFNDFFGNIASKRYTGWKKPEGYKEPKILKLARFSPEIAKRALKDKLLAKPEFFDACIYKEGSSVIINKDLITTLSHLEAQELASYIKDEGIDLLQALADQPEKGAILFEKGLISKAELYSSLLHKKDSLWVVEEAQVSQLAKEDLKELITLIPKDRASVIAIARKSPTIANQLFLDKFRYKGAILGETEFSKNDLFDVIVFKNEKNNTLINDALLQKLSKEDLFALLKFAKDKKLSLDELKPLVDVKLGLSALFIPSLNGENVLNEEVLAVADHDGSLSQLIKYLEEFHQDQQGAIFMAKDRMSLSLFSEGLLKGKELLNAAFYENHFNKKLITNMQVSDLILLKAQVQKTANKEALEFINTILEAKGA